MGLFGKNFTKDPTEKQKVGNLGEAEACWWLKKQGFSILERNYLKKCGEIDIVAKKGKVLHFVEVKTVTRETLMPDGYEPEDNLHPWKLKRLSKTIEIYLLEREVGEEVDWQVDSLSVYLNPAGKVLKIEFLEEIL